MLKDITVGQFYPGNSLVHKLDPRLKIIIMLFYIISLFFVNTYIPYVFIALYLLLIIKVADIPLKIVLKGIRPLKWILLITFVINLFFIQGEEIFRIGFLSITKEGLDTALKMAIRLVLLVLGTSLLTLTTSPIEMTDGIEELLNPLKKIKVPAHEIAMMMTIALRFIPTLIEETDKIMKAQMARGADFESGNILNRAKNLVPLLVPLFINSFRRADDLATAMEARCYRGGEGRTKFRELKLKKADYLTFIFNIVFFGVIIFWRYI
ncbi:energy-coupling factor transporter transmembrane component T family protein [Peptoniphilus stercorisuis]|uniref:Energy-coupling factor transporter transmembrane protein EcfT n=1 Tax=Peptoniphilus stercorisuis TaxID=1436965 RepID=A0ABS4KA87_9FIRM|nr:energy-coupling factor transporter transmembrane component T [Peptoniphilus stercorisuis]MBP2024686.1 energy-coupling factor transport system permease protein [Peptoniphilus stercorisuis]